MQISQNLKLKQSQSLAMTPQLQQAIKLLQLNNLELSNLINKELEENPFLENDSSEELNEVSNDKTEDLTESFSSGESIADEPKNDYENRWDTDSFQTYENKNSNYDSFDPGSVLEQTLSEKISLKSILKSQAQLEFTNDREREISEREKAGRESIRPTRISEREIKNITNGIKILKLSSNVRE